MPNGGLALNFPPPVMVDHGEVQELEAIELDARVRVGPLLDQTVRRRTKNAPKKPRADDVQTLVSAGTISLKAQ